MFTAQDAPNNDSRADKPAAPNQYDQETFIPRDSKHLYELINALVKKIESQWRPRGFEAPELRVRAVMEEAVLNAWQHGHHMNPATAIIVRWYFKDDFFIEVLDQGDGFDPASAPDPTLSENITKSTGRGIFIIRYFAKDITWSNRGRRIIISLDQHFDRKN